MKRSEINTLIEQAIELFDTHNFKLPPFAYWSAGQWKDKGDEVREIRENALGWDVTDYGLGRFHHTGLLLFTIRNGNFRKKEAYPKGYAEKIMVVRENQITPWHFHWNKREDIINRGGGDLVVELYMADESDKFSNLGLDVSVDGMHIAVPPGGKIILSPGESICLEPYMYHTFYGRTGSGSVIVGEVSDVNDDHNDNRFYEELGRFPDIVEDESLRYYLCNEYPPAK